MQDTAKHIDLEDCAVFKFWALQHPNAFKLARTIIFQWRNASAIVPGKAGKWVVYPRNRWAEWSGLSLDQVKRALKCLEDDGLILRERHRFAGSEVRSFLQPTKHAVQYIGRPADMTRLGTPKATPKQVPKYPKNDLPSAPITAPASAPITAPTGAPTDYTPFPSLPPPSPKLQEGATTTNGGKGKGTQEGKSEEKLTDEELDQQEKNAYAAFMVKLEKLVELDPDELAYQQSKDAKEADRLANVRTITKNKKMPKDQKRAKLLALLPKHPLAAASLWHPSDKYPLWHTWSAEHLIQQQDKYDEIVANKKSKSGGKPSKWIK